jgi:hypothetical protein
MVEVEVDGAPYMTFVAPDDDRLPELMKTAAPIMVSFYGIRAAAVRRETLQEVSAVAFIPPLAILILGSLIAWAIRGFRS